jgi:hypothetical protein
MGKLKPWNGKNRKNLHYPDQNYLHHVFSAKVIKILLHYINDVIYLNRGNITHPIKPDFNESKIY